MTEIRKGMRVRSLRDTIPGVEHSGGYLGRVGTVTKVGPKGDKYVDVQWDNDVDDPWFWPIADVEIVEGESSV